MLERMKINDHISVGAQPNAEQLQELAREGFKSIVNLRMTAESEQPFSPDEEGKKVKDLGMQYLHLPVSSEAMQSEKVDQFRQHVGRLPGPVFVHCHKGKRAGALAMMHSAVEAGWTGDQTLKTAEQMGFQCDVPALAEFVKKYVDQNRK